MCVCVLFSHLCLFGGRGHFCTLLKKRDVFINENTFVTKIAIISSILSIQSYLRDMYAYQWPVFIVFKTHFESYKEIFIPSVQISVFEFIHFFVSLTRPPTTQRNFGMGDLINIIRNCFKMFYNFEVNRLNKQHSNATET